MAKKRGGSKRGKSKQKHPSSKSPHSAKKGRLLEEIAARMHSHPQVRVLRNVKLPAPNRNRKFPREIDVLLSSTTPLGDQVVKIIECKNLKGKVNESTVDAFIGKLKDIGISHNNGVMISASGYTADALDRASTTGIKLLTLTGLTEDRLDSIKSEASQFSVFYLPQVAGISLTNNVDRIDNPGEIMLFFDEKGEFCGTILDLIWNRWREWTPVPEAGEHQLKLQVPTSWHQVINGKEESVISIDVTLQVWALVLKIPGKASHHTLNNARNNSFERGQINVDFEVPTEKTSLPLQSFRTEAELEAYLDSPELFRLTSRRPLPKIQHMDLFFYPMSQKVVSKLNEELKEIATGKEPSRSTLMEIEGTDLSAMWEPHCENYPGKAVPVIVTTDEGETIDVSGLMRAGAYGRVVELREYYERNKRPEFGELLFAAYMLQGEMFLEKAESEKGQEARRLISIAKQKVLSALRINPNSPDAYNNLGVVLKAMGEFDEALDSFERALSFDSGQPKTWVNIARALKKLKRYDDSLKSFDRAIELAPNDIDLILQKGGVLKKLGREEESIDCFNRALSIEADNIEALFLKGLTLIHLERHEEAVAALDLALKVDEGNSAVLAHRGYAKHKLEMVRDALADYNAALKLNPELDHILILRALSHAHLGKNEEAESDFENALARIEGDEVIWSGRATVQQRLGRLAAASESYGKALEYSPDNKEFLQNRGRILHQLERYEEALACFNQLAEIEPDSAEAWYGKGLALYNLERDEEAVSAFDRVISISDEWYGTWSNRALCLIELNRLGEALSSANRALELTTETPATFAPLLVRGKVFHYLSQFEEAANDIISAWEIDSTSVLSCEEYRSMFIDLFGALTDPPPKAMKLHAEILAYQDDNGAEAA